MIAAAILAAVFGVLAVAVVTGGFEDVRYFDAPGEEQAVTLTEAP